jgi:glucosylglycerate synthase
LTQDSLLSDELLRHLMAVGHVDVLVGVPTLNNASTISGVVEAVHQAFARYFPRDRTLLVNSDGGSDDGTAAILRDHAGEAAGTVTVTHGLRTMHRINAPYHGVPGKGNALRQILTAADLTQAKAVAVLDADVTSVTPEWIAALIRPVRDQQFDYVAPVYVRHALEGPLVTQIVRPLIRAAYGWQVKEPLAAEFGCSSRFLTHCLEQDVWESPLAQYGIDLWVTGTALSHDFRCCQAPLGPRVQSVAPNRPAFHEVFQQVIGSVFDCLEEDAEYWLTRGASDQLPLVGPLPTATGDAPPVDGRRMTGSFCADVRNLQSVLEPILSGDTLAALNRIADAERDRFLYPDDLWVSTVYQFLVAYHRGVMRRDHISQALIPLYLGRTGSFLQEYGSAEESDVHAALESLCRQFEQSKPDLVDGWTQQARGES